MGELARNSLAFQIAELIRQKIKDGKLRPGDALGTEVRFAEELGVSRNIVREAIGRLRALGIVEGKQRVGLVVGQTDPVYLFDQGLPLFAVNEPVKMNELAKLRYVLEMGAIELAVQNASHEQIEKMRELADQMEEMQKQGKNKESNFLEEKFHSLILKSSGSELLARMHVVLSRFFINAYKKKGGYDPVDEQSLSEHKEIAEAFRRKDVEVVRSLLQRHLQKIFNDA